MSALNTIRLISVRRTRPFGSAKRESPFQVSVPWQPTHTEVEIMFSRRPILALVATAALVLPLIPEALAGSSQNITHSTCQAYGHTHTYTGYTGASTTLTAGGGDCWRYLQFTWYDPYFPEYVAESPTSGYSDRWDDVSLETDAYSTHKVKRDDISGEASVGTNTWQ